MANVYRSYVIYEGFERKPKENSYTINNLFYSGAGTYFYESIWWIFRRQIYAIQFHLQYTYFPVSGLRPNRIISLVGSPTPLSIDSRQQTQRGPPVIHGFCKLSAFPDVNLSGAKHSPLSSSQGVAPVIARCSIFNMMLWLLYSRCIEPLWHLSI